jgi:hypothetical protein
MDRAASWMKLLADGEHIETWNSIVREGRPCSSLPLTASPYMGQSIVSLNNGVSVSLHNGAETPICYYII